MYVDLLPPCNAACPAGENIQGWLALAQDGEYERAWRTPVQDNPFAAIHGRVCYHPCESSCNRAKAPGQVACPPPFTWLGSATRPRFATPGRSRAG